MIDATSKAAICLDDRVLADLVQTELIKNKINSIIQFNNVDECYEVLSRQQVDVIVVGLNLPDNPGITLLQRLRACGNYGFEPFLFMGDKLDPATLDMFIEYDVDYVLTPPFDKQKVNEKIAFMIKRENAVPESLQQYRDAKSAFTGGILEMAEEMTKSAMEDPNVYEKAAALLGQIATEQEKFSEAMSIYKELLTKNPKSLSVLHYISKCLVKQGKIDEAKKYLDALVAKSPNHISVLEGAGLTNYNLGHIELAEKQMNKLAGLDSTNKTAGKVKTDIAISRGEFDGISEMLKKSHTEQELVSLLNSAGVKLSKDGDIEGAIKIYKECLTVVRKKDFKGKIDYNLAIAYKRLENKERAIAHCKRALESIPDFQKAKDMIKELE